MSSASILWEIGQKKAKKVEYETRKVTVNGIRNAVPNVADGYVRYANNKIDLLANALQNGMSSMGVRSNLCDAVIEAKEKRPDDMYNPDVNLDGTIRGNSLFKGEHLGKIEKIIDLSQYGSLEEFKTQRRTELNEISEQNKKAYYDKVGTGHWKNPSPYMDEEVIKVMSLSK